MVGQTISHYKITEKLGEGGMGVVYKAEDTKLDRPVALKFLAAHAIEDPEHKARFVREAKAAARLDHQNICPVHEIDEADGHTFLAMAYLEGRTVKDEIAERPLKLVQALDIAVQTAQGLQAAHEKDIVHRDIKSANLMVTPQGQVKIMDFGLAQLAERSKLTETTTILGTPSYMSPEQAVGEKTDRRTDLWSLGVVLYEMVTGRLPFEGERQEAVLYKIGSEEPEPVTALRAGLPMELEWIIGKALAKDRDERYQHAEDLLVDLRSLQKKLASGSSTILKTQPASQTGGAPPRSAEQIERQYRRKQTVLLVAAALGVLLALVFAFFPLFSPAPVAETPVRRFSFSPEGLLGTIDDSYVSISPDGKYIVYAAQAAGHRALWLRPLNSESARKLEGTEGATGGHWSPDSKIIVFGTDRELKRIPRDGGNPITLCELPGGRIPFLGASWSTDGSRIVFSSGLKLYEVAARGGEPELLFEPDESESARSFWAPHFLPSSGASAGLVYTAARGPDNRRVGLLDLKTGERRELGPGDVPRYSMSGHLIHGPSVGDDTGLWALPFSLESLTTTGEAFPIGEAGEYATIARDGTLAYFDGPAGLLEKLVWRDRTGEVLETVGQPQEGIESPTVSPDGRLLAFSAIEGANRDIWIHDPARGTKTRLTFDEGTENRPAWSPSGKEITYRWAQRDGSYLIASRAADGTGEATVLVDAKANVSSPDWSHDGKHLVYWEIGTDNGRNLRYLKRSGDGFEPTVFLSTPANEASAKFSPDGRYIAYASDESGRREVYVRPFPKASKKWQVSVNGGTQPRWRQDGRELFYVEESTLMAVAVSTEQRFVLGQPQRLFESDDLRLRTVTLGWGSPEYDVSADGNRFLTVTPVEDENARSPAIRVVQNWYEEFRDREQD